MPKYKTIYILLEDQRDTHRSNITGKICYSLEEACEKLLRRIWYYEPSHRKYIKEMWNKHGPIKAFHDHVWSAWIYCPSYVKKRVKVQ